MDALLVVDMQEGMLQGGAKHGLPAVIERINRIAARVRTEGGAVFFIQHDGPPCAGPREAAYTAPCRSTGPRDALERRFPFQA